MARNELDGAEHSLGSPWPGGQYLTANVTFFAKADTLFANPSAFKRLTDDQRTEIRDAARETVAHVAARPPPEDELIRRYCDGGRVVTASPDDLAALARAAQPVYAELERDPRTRALIAAIRELKGATPTPPAAAVRCAPQAEDAHGRRISPSTLNGTYRWRLTRAAAIASGNPDDPDVGNISQMTLRDGRWLSGQAGRREPNGSYPGTYEIVGNRISFTSPELADTNTFTFTRHANGDLDLKPVLPMDPGDAFEFSSARWHRVGPPIAVP
jgi:hypothetical protein